MQTFTTLLALAATAAAATVKLEQTACIQPTTLESFDVPLNTLFVKSLPTTCGLKLVSADGAALTSITCRAYKDAAGTQSGSSEFNSTSPALIATNPVQIAAVRCVDSTSSKSVSGTAYSTVTGTATTSLVGTTTSTSTVAGNGTASVPSTTGSATGGNSGNGTAPGATNTPTQPASSTPSGSGAERLGLSLGVVAAGLAVFVF